MHRFPMGPGPTDVGNDDLEQQGSSGTVKQRRQVLKPQPQLWGDVCPRRRPTRCCCCPPSPCLLYCLLLLQPQLYIQYCLQLLLQLPTAQVATPVGSSGGGMGRRRVTGDRRGRRRRGSFRGGRLKLVKSHVPHCAWQGEGPATTRGGAVLGTSAQSGTGGGGGSGTDDGATAAAVQCAMWPSGSRPPCELHLDPVRGDLVGVCRGPG